MALATPPASPEDSALTNLPHASAEHVAVNVSPGPASFFAKRGSIHSHSSPTRGSQRGCVARKTSRALTAPSSAWVKWMGMSAGFKCLPP